MSNIEIIPNSNIINWEQYDTASVKYNHFIVTDKVSFLSNKAPKIRSDDSLEISGAKIYRVSGMNLRNGTMNFCTKEIHLRPNPKQLQDIHKMIGLTHDNKQEAGG